MSIRSTKVKVNREFLEGLAFALGMTVSEFESDHKFSEFMNLVKEIN